MVVVAEKAEVVAEKDVAVAEKDAVAEEKVAEVVVVKREGPVDAAVRRSPRKSPTLHRRKRPSQPRRRLRRTSLRPWDSTRIRTSSSRHVGNMPSTLALLVSLILCLWLVLFGSQAIEPTREIRSSDGISPQEQPTAPRIA